MNYESVSRKTKTLQACISRIRLVLFWYLYLYQEYSEGNNLHRGVGSLSLSSSSAAKGSEKPLGKPFIGFKGIPEGAILVTGNKSSSEIEDCL